VPRAAQAARHGQPATHQHLQQRARLAKAERDNARMLQACKAVFAPVMAGMQQADTGRSIAQDILDADDDGEAAFELPSLGGMRQPAAAGLLSPGSFNTPGVPQPLFNGAGGAAAGPSGSRQQQRRSSAQPPPTTAAAAGAGAQAGAAGRSHLQSAAGSAAAAEGGAPAADYQDGQPAAEAVNPLVALGFEVSPEDLGVLGIRGWSTGPSAAQTLPSDAAAATGLGAAATSDAAAAGVYGSEGDVYRSAGGGGAAAAASRGAGSWGPQAQHAPQQQQQRLRTAALGQGGLAGRQPQQQQQGQQHQSEQGRTRWQQPQGQSMPAQPPGSAEAEFGPEDLPGANAPGYGPRSSFYQPSQRTHRTAAPTAGRRSQLPPGGSTGTSNPAAARHTVAAVSSRPFLPEEPAAKRVRLQQQSAAGAGRGTPAGGCYGHGDYDAATAAGEDDDDMLADNLRPSFGAAMGSPSAAAAAAAATAAAAAPSAADSDQPDAKRARLSAAASEDSSEAGAAVPQPPTTFDHQQQQQQEGTGADSDGGGILEFPVFAPSLQPQQQGGHQQQQQPQGMLDRALWCRQQVEELMQEGIGPDGLPYDELCHELTRVMNAGLDANSDFDKALVAGSLGAGEEVACHHVGYVIDVAMCTQSMQTRIQMIEHQSQEVALVGKQYWQHHEAMTFRVKGLLVVC